MKIVIPDVRLQRKMWGNHEFVINNSATPTTRLHSVFKLLKALAGWSTEDMAEQLKVSTRTMSGYLIGRPLSREAGEQVPAMVEAAHAAIGENPLLVAAASKDAVPRGTTQKSAKPRKGKKGGAK